MSTILDESEMVHRLGLEQMAKLRANASRQHWRVTEPRWLMAQLKDKVRELERAWSNGGPLDDVWAEAADVANYAAMIADRLAY